MLPLLPFATGLLAGAFTVKLLRSERARSSLEKAQDKLREATASGFAAVRKSSPRKTAEKPEPKPEKTSAPKTAKKSTRKKAAAAPASGRARKSAKTAPETAS